MTGFHWDDITDPINGFEVYINLKRKGRILDETIGLWYNGEQVGGSKADGDLSNIKTYGGSGDTWNFEQISSGILNSGNFGLLLRYQSNINWPHRDTPNMIQVQARVW